MPYTDIIRIIDAPHPEAGASFVLITGKECLDVSTYYFPDLNILQAAKDYICSQAKVNPTPWDVRFPSKEQSIAGNHSGPLHYSEPEDWERYRTHLVTKRPFWPRFAKAFWFFLRFHGLALAPWLLLYFFDLTDSFIGYLGIITPGALLFTALHWLNSVYPVRCGELVFSQNGITELSGKQIWDFNYSEVTGWNMIERQYEGRPINILLLKWRDHIIARAIPDIITRDKIAQRLSEKQRLFSADIQPDWE